jgi:predicted outer membrane repeat protein
MKTMKVATMAIGTGALLLAFAVTPAAVASATPPAFVPCSSGAAGLIAAINAANVAGGTINLAPGCTYLLTAPATTTPIPMIGGLAGLPAITNQVTINGFNTTIARSSTSAAPFRIFEVDAPSGNLTLQGLTITGGNSTNGGAIANLSAATLNHTDVTGNTASGSGGGIATAGTMTLNGSQVNGNTALASGMGGGGGIVNHGGVLSVNFSQVNNNVSNGGGGGIASGNGAGGATPPPPGTLNLFSSQVNGNTSNGGPMAGAGGIANGSNATITLSLVNNNTAPGATGGGILNHGTMTINLSAVDNNTAPSDSASPPDPGIGGGIGNFDFGVPNSGVLTMNLSQVVNNTASGSGGGIAEGGFGSGPGLVAGNTLAVNFSLVTGNSATGGGGGIFAVPGSPVTLKFALIFRNAPDNCEPLNGIAGCHN